jgi:hypothetical protein
MRKLIVATSLILAFTNASFAADRAAQDDLASQQELFSQQNPFDHTRKILTFSTMYGVDGPFVGDANPVRGVIGDELPWDVSGFIIGDLDTNGRLRILVHGLVFADDPSVPPGLVGTNDEPEFRGLVSCLTENGDSIETQNVVTRGFHASPRGDSFIHATVDLPSPCVAPIVMVLAGSEDKWFAITGFESEGGMAPKSK